MTVTRGAQSEGEVDPSEEEGSPDSLARQVWSYQRAFYYYASAHFDRILADFGLTRSEARTLVDIEPGGAYSMGRLALMWMCDASTVTWMIGRAERLGLVGRRTSPEDRRVRVVALTPRGEEIRATLCEALASPPPMVEELTEEDLTSLLTLVRKLPLKPVR
jgi:DNA-binding MarR family transcriptional regulator